ncbi:TetR/AcrR family transcriptional regulator [Nocardia sp. NBC_01503]|uniref:TetR/AcrR family transcriptional regulator n=1 Tax=Nocardia sp. NBC_01503 TaxID=2975997 RepID=UPI002E7B8C90|nr:TetR/AcrR family transcriptional regulator [Nocardia sp. NBC_01503]WTL30221.1 TetR/AcrR family transcriptional regulator [Nocardia sp. NBC_01503]
MEAPPTAKPMRADARRNYERIVTTAQAAFAELGPETALEEIARRAGVGIGTLYRHFPNREVLIETVYRSNIEQLSQRAHELLESNTPTKALELWLREQVNWVMANRSLATTLKAGIDHDSPTFTLCRTAINDAATALLAAAQSEGAIRTDIEPRDLLRFGHGIGVACETTPEAADRLLAVTLDGMRTSPKARN